MVRSSLFDNTTTVLIKTQPFGRNNKKNMRYTHSIAAAIALICSILSVTSAESEYEADATSNIRGSSTEKLDFKVSPLEREEHVDRRLQSSSCTGNNRMCGCSNVRQSDYRGRFKFTRNGFRCKEWSQAASFPGMGLEDGAFCRNPNGVGRKAWCFVEEENGVKWDYCDVPMCEAGTGGGSSGNGDENITPGCFNTERYNDIYADIESIKNSIGNDVDRSHFLGGIVRLVAHDFMDYDVSKKRKPLGPDGCLILDSPMNAGLGSIWCDRCSLKQLYDKKYSDLSRADFWVAAANAVIYLTSIDNSLDLRNTFYWGRTTVDSCPGSDSRLPTTAGCQDVEDVFLTRMGLTWKDAVALLGAHTLGRGHLEVRRSGLL